MGKFWGIGGGFVRGCLVAFCVGIVIAVLTCLVFISMLAEADSQGESEYSGMWIGLLFTTYFMGCAAVLYYGVGYTYDHGHEVGLKECKENIPVAQQVVYPTSLLPPTYPEADLYPSK